MHLLQTESYSRAYACMPLSFADSHGAVEIERTENAALLTKDKIRDGTSLLSKLELLQVCAILFTGYSGRLFRMGMRLRSGDDAVRETLLSVSELGNVQELKSPEAQSGFLRYNPGGAGGGGFKSTGATTSIIPIPASKSNQVVGTPVAIISKLIR